MAVQMQPLDRILQENVKSIKSLLSKKNKLIQGIIASPNSKERKEKNERSKSKTEIVTKIKLKILRSKEKAETETYPTIRPNHKASENKLSADPNLKAKTPESRKT